MAVVSAQQGRILGLDAGDRRIGVAISDPDRHFALPLNSVVRDGRGGEFAAIERLVAEEQVGEIVVGLPLSLSGVAGTQAEAASSFARELESRLQIGVHLYDERLSTQEALRRVSNEHRPERRGGGRERREKQRGPAPDTDALAASIILQAYLDRQRLAGTAPE